MIKCELVLSFFFLINKIMLFYASSVEEGIWKHNNFNENPYQSM